MNGDGKSVWDKGVVVRGGRRSNGRTSALAASGRNVGPGEDDRVQNANGGWGCRGDKGDRTPGAGEGRGRRRYGGSNAAPTVQDTLLGV